MDMKTVGKWSYLVGLVIVIVAALFKFQYDWLSIIIAVLAILTGLFLGDTKELTNYGVRYMALALVAGTLTEFPFLGEYITAIAQAMVSFFGPIVLTVLFVFNFNQAMDWIRGK